MSSKGGFHSNPNVACVVAHCSQQSGACALDQNCRRNMECMISCGLTNTPCLYTCMNTYENDVFDAFMRCLVDDHHCLTLTSPDPNFRCTPPTPSSSNFSLADLEGNWHIVLGLNKQFDCFDCQTATYSPTPNSRNYTLMEKYAVKMLNGSVRSRVNVQQVAQRDVFHPGVLALTSSMMGLAVSEEWRVIGKSDSESYIIMYYCGRLTADWWFEGGVVYSRTPELTSDDRASVASSLHDKLGRDIDTCCAVKTEPCSDLSTIY